MGKTILINLIDKKNDQKNIGELFENIAKDQKENLNHSYEFVWFDFHHECKGMKYEKLSNLLRTNSVIEGLRNLDFTHVQINSNFTFNNYSYKNDLNINIVSEQKGVFRVNCVDSLDRTNVVHSVICRQIVHKILYKLKLTGLQRGEAFEQFLPQFEPVFKAEWANNGDSLAIAYAGTKAMKGDFTRYGKKTYKGTLMDGVYSVKRYFINNFKDGYNQDCADFSLGKISHKYPNIKEHSNKFLLILMSLTFILIFILYNFAISIALPKEYEDNKRKLLLRFLVFIGISYLTTNTIFSNLRNKVIDVQSSTDY